MRRLTALGLAALALAATTMALPGLLAIPLGRAPVYLLGVGALLAAYPALRDRRRAGVRRTGTSDPEVAAGVPVPGADLYDAIREVSGGRAFYVRSALRDAAVAALVRYDGRTREAARAAVDDGSWTDDSLAASYLREETRAAPVADRLRRWLRRESRHEAGKRRAGEAIARLAGVDVEPTPGGRLARELPLTDRVETVDVEAAGRIETGSWRGAGGIALLAVGLGALSGAAPVLLAGVAVVGLLAYARAAPAPTPDLAVERVLDDGRPRPGDAVGVTLTVRNAGDRLLPDLRVVDGVPAALAVSDGSPRIGTALAPGDAATLRYEVTARRGVHAFEPVTVLVRDAAGVTEHHDRLEAAGELTCIPGAPPSVEAVPTRRNATRYAGRVATDSGGEGVEFFGTRAYQPGDPPGRIDWNRRARTGELATIDYREERASTVVVVVDARPPAYVAHDPHAPHAVDRSIDAAYAAVEWFLDAGDRVGIAAFGTECWLPPGTGEDHRRRVADLLATAPALASVPPAAGPPPQWRRRLRRRLPTGAELLVLTPLVDAPAARLVRTLDAAGHPASVISPDPTVGTPTGPLLARVARRFRMTDLRRAGVPVVDWPAGEPLPVVLARAAEGSA